MLHSVAIPALILVVGIVDYTVAAIHKLQLEKNPFNQQLTTFDVQSHARALANKYDQKLLSSPHATGFSQFQSVGSRGGYEWPIENQYNAECMDV